MTMKHLMYLPLGFLLGLILAAGDKPPPVSLPIAPPTEIVVEKGTIGPETGPLGAGRIQIESSRVDGINSNGAGGQDSAMVPDSGGHPSANDTNSPDSNSREDVGYLHPGLVVDSQVFLPLVMRGSELPGRLGGDSVEVAEEEYIGWVSPYGDFAQLPIADWLQYDQAFRDSVTSLAWCESKYRVYVISPTGDWGFLQINRRWQEGRVIAMGYSMEDMLTLKPNLDVGYAIWLEQGSFSAWSCKVGVVDYGHD